MLYCIFHGFTPKFDIQVILKDAAYRSIVCAEYSGVMPTLYHDTHLDPSFRQFRTRIQSLNETSLSLEYLNPAPKVEQPRQ